MDDDELEAKWAADDAAEAANRKRKAEAPPAMDRNEFLAWRSPRIGNDNPTRLDNPLWQWMVRTRWSGFQANEIFKGPIPIRRRADVVFRSFRQKRNAAAGWPSRAHRWRA